MVPRFRSRAQHLNIMIDWLYDMYYIIHKGIVKTEYCIVLRQLRTDECHRISTTVTTLQDTFMSHRIRLDQHGRLHGYKGNHTAGHIHVSPYTTRPARSFPSLVSVPVLCRSRRNTAPLSSCAPSRSRPCG